MERTIGVERVYKVNDYNTLRLSDTLSNVPEELMLNPDFVNKVRFLQFVELERGWIKYSNLFSTLDKMTAEEGVAKVNELKIKLTSEIAEIIESTLRKEK